jgi:hypothetical protein
VKDQYFGDARDYLKYQLLDALIAGVLTVRQLTCLRMLTPNDATAQGSRPLRPNSEAQELAQFLSRFLDRGDRRVRHLRDYYRSRGTPYNPYGDEAPPYFTNNNRTDYFSAVPDEHLRDAVVFVDPDNGLSFGAATAKHLHIRDLTRLWHRMGDTSVLVVIQFRQRKSDFWSEWGRQIQNAVGPNTWTASGVVGFYVLHRGAENARAVDAVIKAFARQASMAHSAE